jgi:bacillithiol system protein YtxJ
MKDGFTELSDTDSLDRFLAEANGSPVVLLKHSDSCGISARAYQDLAKFAGPVGLVTVQTARAVSDEIEKRTGVGHETPQVFILREGKVLWTASHGQVKTAAVESALAEISGRGAVVSGR